MERREPALLTPELMSEKDSKVERPASSMAVFRRLLPMAVTPAPGRPPAAAFVKRTMPPSTLMLPARLPLLAARTKVPVSDLTKPEPAGRPKGALRVNVVPGATSMKFAPPLLPQRLIVRLVLMLPPP